LARKAHKVTLAHKGRKALKAHKAHKVTLARRACKARRVHRVYKALWLSMCTPPMQLGLSPQGRPLCKLPPLAAAAAAVPVSFAPQAAPEAVGQAAVALELRSGPCPRLH
jgi:hypothetical protein